MPHRRKFLTTGLFISVGLGLGIPKLLLRGASPTTQTKRGGYFTLGQRKGHWFLLTPDGRPFFTVGLNHLDPASLRYPENLKIWKDKYDGSTIKWIKESVAPNLQAWGFNTVGWVQEVSVKLDVVGCHAKCDRIVVRKSCAAGGLDQEEGLQEAASWSDLHGGA